MSANSAALSREFTFAPASPARTAQSDLKGNAHIDAILRISGQGVRRDISFVMLYTIDPVNLQYHERFIELAGRLIACPNAKWDM